MSIPRFSKSIAKQLIPKISRQQILEDKNSQFETVVIENSYFSDIKEPLDQRTAMRLEHLTRRVAVPAFFFSIFKDVRLIGPYGLALTRRGKFIAENIEDPDSLHRGFYATLGMTVRYLGWRHFLFE